MQPGSSEPEDNRTVVTDVTAATGGAGVSKPWQTSGSSRDLLGHVLGGRYELKELLGEGGMSSVFLSRHKELDQLVAVKVLRYDLASGEENQKRFLQEAKATFHLYHQNLIRLLDFSAAPGEMPYLVMEYVSGKTLSELLREKKRFNIDEFISLFAQVCDGLSYAHSKGIVHRDLKPSNIMLAAQPDGSELVKIVDFGIAKISQLESEQHLTKTGAILGSPFYMSPEQCRGLNPDHRSDLYSLGCAMFECLNGSVPYHGENSMQTMFMHIEKPVPTASLPKYKSFEGARSLSDVVFKLLQKNPDDRFQSASEVKSALLACSDSKACRDEQASPKKLAPRKKALSASLVATVAVIALAGSATAAWFASHPKSMSSNDKASNDKASNVVPALLPREIPQSGETPANSALIPPVSLVNQTPSGETPSKLAALQAKAAKANADASRKLAADQAVQANIARELAALRSAKQKAAIEEKEAEKSKELTLKHARQIESPAQRQPQTVKEAVPPPHAKLPYSMSEKGAVSTAGFAVVRQTGKFTDKLSQAAIDKVQSQYLEALSNRSSGRLAEAESLCVEAMKTVVLMDRHRDLAKRVPYFYLMLLNAVPDSKKNYLLMESISHQLESAMDVPTAMKPLERSQILGWHGHLLMAEEKFDLAYTFYARAAEIAKSVGTEGDERWTNWISSMARALSKQHKNDTALDLCNRCERVAVNQSPKALFNIVRAKAQVQWNLGQTADARKTLKRAEQVASEAKYNKAGKELKTLDDMRRRFDAN